VAEVPRPTTEAPETEKDQSAKGRSMPRFFYQDTRWRLGSLAIWGGVAFVILIALLVVTAAQTGRPELIAKSLLPRALVIALMALPMALIFASGGIDLSAGATAGLVAVVVGSLFLRGVLPIALAVISGLLLAVLIGVVNGLLVSVAKIHGVIVTLGMMTLLQGIANIVADPRGVGAGREQLAQLAGLASSPVSWGVLILFTIVGALSLQLTPFGRRPRPGSDEKRESALARILFVGLPYVLSGAAAGLAGILLLGWFGNVMPGVGISFQTDAVLAVLIGGTPLGGGFGSAVGSVVGALVVAALDMILARLQIAGPAPLAMAITKGVLFVFVALLCQLYYHGAGWLFKRRRATRAAEATPAVAEQAPD